MLIDMNRCEKVHTIQKMLNVDEETAASIYDEAGVSIEKIYNSLKNQKPKIHSDKKYSRCLRCGRPLKSEESKICGYGTICKDKVSKRSIKKNFIEVTNGVKSGAAKSSK